MKKILSLILALTMMLSLSIYAFAAELSESVVENAFGHLEKLIDAESEARYSVAKDEIRSLYTVIKDSAITDYNTLADKMKDYADTCDSDIAPIFSDMESVKDILSMFISENIVNIDSLQGQIQDSDSLNKALTLYTGAYIVKAPSKDDTSVTKVETTAAEEQDPESEDETTTTTTNTAYEPPKIENPKTGDSSAGTIIALAVLGVSVATIAIASKKKSSDEE